MRPLRKPAGGLSAVRVGVLLIAATAVAGVLIFYKDQIQIALAPTSTVTVHLPENYGLTAYKSKVKIAGLETGDITEVSEESGGATVTIELADDAQGKLRSAPSARVRPSTLLGGNYYVDLVPGDAPGTFSGDIPVTRTTVPVEMDKISRTLQPDTLRSMQGTVRNLDGALEGDGRAALQRLLADAPATLGPGTEVLEAARGTQPGEDLPRLVGGLQRTAATLTDQHGQLESIVGDANKTATILGRNADELGRTIHTLPATLDSADNGLARLGTSLSKLRDTAGPARPVARELDNALAHLDPALTKAKPLVSKLNPLLTQARPLVDALTPTAIGGSAVLDDVRGPVLDRLNGPIKKTVLSPYSGTGHYQNSGSDRPFYQELAYMVTGMDRLAQTTDANGAAVGYGIGVTPGTVGGLPISLEQLFGHLSGIGQKGDR